MTFQRLSKLGHIIISGLFVLSMTLQAVLPAMAQSGADVRIQRHPQTGKVSFIGSAPGKPIRIRGAEAPGLGQQDRALAMIQPYAADFGLKQASRELKLEKADQLKGRQVTRFQQTYQDVPVMAGELVVNADDQGGLLSINGEISPDLNLDTRPAISAPEAERTALQSVAQWYTGKTSDFQATQPALWIYDSRLLQPDRMPPSLVWRMDVTAKDPDVPLRELVLVDAQRGNIALHFNQVDTGWSSQLARASDAPTEVPTEVGPSSTVAELPPGETSVPIRSTPNLAALQGAEPALAGTTRYVATTGTDTGACTSPGSPCRTINYALGQADAGDTVEVGSGTYTGGNTVVTITKSINILGGWDAGFTTQNGQSILDGQATSTMMIYVWGSSLLVGISQLTTQNGGYGIYDNNPGGTLTLNRVALINSYHGIYNGNGIYNYDGNVNFINSTISGNYSGGTAGVAISNVSGNINVQYSTITNNSGPYNYAIYGLNGSAHIEIGNSILAGNPYGDCWANLTSSGYNIFGHSPPCEDAVSTQPSDKIGLDPLLAPLAPAGYHPLIAGSPAIDAAGSPCPATDQRGISRPYGIACDIGASEWTPPGPAANVSVWSGSNQRLGFNQTLPTPLAAYVTDAAGSPVSGVTVTFTAPSSGPSGTFADSGTATTTAVTAASGIATSSSFTTNAVNGTFDITASVAGVGGTANFSIDNFVLFVSPAGDDTWNCLTPTTPCQTIPGAMAKVSAGDTIVVTTATYTGSSSSAVLTIPKGIWLSGGWNNDFTAQTDYTTFDGQELRQGIHITSTAAVTLSHVIVQNGYMVGSGGGIGVDSSTMPLTVIDSIIRNNTAFGASGAVSGGGINANMLTVAGSSITGNQVQSVGSSGGYGGGIASQTLSITQSYIDHNAANYSGSYLYPTALGGGIYTWVLHMSRSTVSNNSASATGNSYGGGLVFTDGTSTIDNSSIFGNIAGYGGGLSTSIGAVINNSTITGNQAAYGGGLYKSSSGVVTIRNTILWGNGGNDCYGTLAGIVADHDVISSTQCPYSAGSGNINADPHLVPAAIGDPPYYALVPDSPAINAGNPATCLGIDERGATRPYGSACDIGAYEFTGTGTSAAYLVAYQGSGQVIPAGSTAWVNMKAYVADTQGAPVPGVSVTFVAPASGASGLFSNASNTITPVSDANGIANAGSFTANGTLGAYTVQATAAGVAAPAAFSLINLPSSFGAGAITTYTMNHGTFPLPGTFVCDLSQPGCTNGENPDADHAEQYALDTYLYYQTHFNRNSVDNAGMPLVSSVHYGSSFQNAFWDGSQMVYGDGFSAGLDVVGHELTHGVTQYTSNLFYYYQSGAINESISDVFGELVQRSYQGTGDNWLIGENLPIGAFRSMENPTLFGDPDKMSSQYYSFDPTEADNGGVHRNSGINNKAAYLMASGDSFNGQTVTALGDDKTAAIYYEVETNLLTSGSDYADLYVDLYQACLNLVGGTAGILLSDCQSVQNAVDAVQMNGQPAPNYNTDAPACASGYTAVNQFYDSFENGSASWTFSSSDNRQHWQVDSPYFGPNAHTGDHSLYADDYPGQVADASATMNSAVTLPANAYLHFAQDYDYYNAGGDGGVVEYSANNGAWTDAGSLMDFNAYNGTVVGAGNPLSGRAGFIDVSHGYISTRLNLNSLAGKSVKFRFRMGLDNSGWYYQGWWVDDVQIYTCAYLTANVSVDIGGSLMGTYNVDNHTSIREHYAGVDSGPVVVTSNNALPIVAAIRDLWSDSTHPTSSIQVMGLPASLLSTSYYFPAYNNVSLDDQIRFGNVGSSPTWVTVTIGGVVRGSYWLAPSQSQRVAYAGLDTGPVVVSSSGGVPIIASIRDSWWNGSQWTSYAQLMGLPASQLSSSYYFPAYNNVSLDDQIRFGNVGSSPTWVTVTIGGVVRGSYWLAPSQSQRVAYAGLDSGPVVVSSSGGVPIIASIRDSWWNGTTWTSYAQLMGLPASQLSDTYHFPVYDNASLDGQLRFGNVGGVPTWVTVTIGGVVKGSYYLLPSQSQRVSYASLNSGPVQIQSSGSVPIIASLRDSWWDGSTWTSYAQLMGLPNSQLSTSYYFPAYNNVSLNDELRIGKP